MNFAVAYFGRSGVTASPGGMGLSFAPNLRRDRVAFAADLLDPVRFREAVSALHAVVVGDLKFKPKDRSAYQAYLKRVKEREAGIRSAVARTAKTALLAEDAEPMPADLEPRFRRLRSRYWDARQAYSDYLSRNDPALFRALVPCDPVVTVAPDAVFFECFSKDESSYGCLTVDRGAFAAHGDVALGTTNVDYSLPLFEEFQRLRTYRKTRFAVDPAGFEVKTEGSADYREEKIDLPPSWLRGFMQVQAAMSLPAKRVPVSREGLYALLGFLTTHRARTSPRAVRFELVPGEPVRVVLEPWEKRIVLHDTPWTGHVSAPSRGRSEPTGPQAETVRIWGRDRLKVLSRLLPLVEGADVFLLGTGLPSFWNVRLGGMRFLLGLSGWTANDWTSGGGALADLAPPADPSEDVLGDIAAVFAGNPTRTFAQVQQATGAAPHVVAAGLNRFALLGQLAPDLGLGAYRWRQILPAELALKQVQVDSPEAAAAKDLVAYRRVTVTRDADVSGVRSVAGAVEGREVELVCDADDRIVRGQCNCSHYFRFKLRAGPCRHMQALRRVANGEQPVPDLVAWYRWLTR